EEDGVLPHPEVLGIAHAPGELRRVEVRPVALQRRVDTRDVTDARVDDGSRVAGHVPDFGSPHRSVVMKLLAQVGPFYEVAAVPYRPGMQRLQGPRRNRVVGV